MKKRLAFLSCLICISANSVVPIWGQDISNTQTRQQINLSAGVGKAMDNIILHPIPERFRIFETKYLNSDANIRYSPSLDSEVVTVLPFNTEVRVFDYSEDWDMVRYDDKIYYVYKDLVSDEMLNYHTYSTPYNTIKSFMGYHKITSQGSEQYKLQQKAYTGEYGIRQVNGRFCIAVGSAYTTTIGQYIDLILENGTIIPCILAECKDDKDTNADNTITFDGSLAEFVVDIKTLNKDIMYDGSTSKACDAWESTIVEIRVYDTVEEY